MCGTNVFVKIKQKANKPNSSIILKVTSDNCIVLNSKINGSN